MTKILTRLSVFNLVVLTATFLIGWVSFARGSLTREDPAYDLHVYFGLLAGVTTLGVHCLVFIYFLGTGRWVKEVGIAYRLPDEPLPKLTRELKRRAFPPALAAMLVLIATSAAGAGVATQEWPRILHALLATATLLVNVWAFRIEYSCVSINAGVIDDVMLQVDRIRAEHGLPSNAEALQQEAETR
jgi:hypothetical protein